MSQAATLEPSAKKTVPSNTETPAPGHDDVREQAIVRARNELSKRLESYQPVKDLTNLTPDRLNDQFSILCDEPLPQFEYGTIKAFAATDDKNSGTSIYAAICDPARPFRHLNLQILEQNHHSNMSNVIAHGIAYISAYNANKHVIICEQPDGQKLSEYIAEGNQFTADQFTQQVIQPIASAIQFCESNGINHCRINPDSIFIGEKTILAECVSQPPGFCQEFIYEPIERQLTSAQGTGGGTTKVDTYSLGVLTLDVLGDLSRFRELSKEAYTGLVLTNGSYNVLISKNKLPTQFKDLLIGTLSDVYEERWSSEQLNLWLTGKRFNLLQPTPPREASRPYEFNGQDFFSARALAQSFFANWETARDSIRNTLLSRWVDQSLHKKEAAELVTRAISNTGGLNRNTQKLNDELLARVLIILDHAGPLRLDRLSFNIAGIGLLLSDAIMNKKQKEIGQILQTIDFDLPNFWSELQQISLSEEAQQNLLKLDRIRHFIRYKGLGFGIERMLYDLNPQIACMSPLLIEYHINTMEQAIYTLDALAKHKYKNTSLMDRHLAAFFASHLKLSKEINIKDLKHHPNIATHPEIIMMIILSKVQERTGIKKLQGLSTWAAYTMLDILENIHSLQTRQLLCRELLQAASHGHIASILHCVVNSRVLNNDLVGYEKAVKLYKINRHKITQLRNTARTREKAQTKGNYLAMYSALLFLGYALYNVVEKYIF